MWLWGAMRASGALSDRRLVSAAASLALSEFAKVSSLGARLEELRGRSVVVFTPDPFTAAIVLVELDGVARRVVLCPPDLSAVHFPQMVREAGSDAWVGDCGCGRERFGNSDDGGTRGGGG